MKRAVKICAILLSLSLTASASRMVRDELGRDVAIPDHPHRLVCLAPSITDMIYQLGFGDDIAGISDYTKYPPEARRKPSVGEVVNPSLEKLASLHPDLVLAVGDLNTADTIHAIERLGFPIFVLHTLGLHGIYSSIEDLGKALDAQQGATALIARLRAREAAVRNRVASKPQPAVFFLLWDDPIMSAGRGAFITELIEAAGGRSVTSNLAAEWPTVSLETLISERPEYLLLVRGSNVTLESLQRQGNWKKLDAVSQGKVFYADERIEYPSPAAFDALEDLADQFHPSGKGTK